MLYLRVMNGCLKKGMTIRLMATGKVYEVTEVGVFKPALVNVEELGEGMVGFLAASIKNVRDARVGIPLRMKTILLPRPCPVIAKQLPWCTVVFILWKIPIMITSAML